VLPQPHDAIAGPLDQLARFAGWLAKDHASVVVRSDVHALSAAIDAGHDTALLMVTLDKDLGRLPSGDLRRMLQKALGQIRVALAAIGVDGRDREDL
jgi:hypothetical protein